MNFYKASGSIDWGRTDSATCICTNAGRTCHANNSGVENNLGKKDNYGKPGGGENVHF